MATPHKAVRISENTELLQERTETIDKIVDNLNSLREETQCLHFYKDGNYESQGLFAEQYHGVSKHLDMIIEYMVYLVQHVGVYLMDAGINIQEADTSGA
jgi:hypothetical protein